MRHLRFMVSAVILFLINGIVAVRAQEASSHVTASITTQGDIWIGQKVTFAIDLLAPGYFSGVPRFDFPQIPGVLLVPPEDHPVLSTKQINGQSFTDQHYEILLFAKKPGTYEIPPFAIRFGIKRSPLDQEPIPQNVKTPALSFSARMPPGAENLSSLISAKDLVVESKWTPSPHPCKVGDAFTRTITYTATDVPGMAFPPFPIAKVEGFGIYPKAPLVSDQSERGELHGKRTDTIVYVCKQPGQFVIPAAQLTWWDITNQTLQTIKFPAQKFDVASNPKLMTQAQPKKIFVSAYLKWMSIGISLIVVLIVILRKIPRKILWEALGFFRSVHLKRLNPE